MGEASQVARFIVPSGAWDGTTYYRSGAVIPLTVTVDDDGKHSPLPGVNWKPGYYTSVEGRDGRQMAAFVEDQFAAELLVEAKAAKKVSRQIEKARSRLDAHQFDDFMEKFKPDDGSAELKKENAQLRSKLAAAEEQKKADKPKAPRTAAEVQRGGGRTPR